MTPQGESGRDGDTCQLTSGADNVAFSSYIIQTFHQVDGMEGSLRNVREGAQNVDMGFLTRKYSTCRLKFLSSLGMKA